MNMPSHPNTPDNLAAPTDAPQTRWVSRKPERLHPQVGTAYLKAQAGGFRPGHELDAWLCMMADLTQRAGG